ncbi:hypothetical protein WAJ05_21045, partial [Acinetobacter baumannii]
YWGKGQIKVNGSVLDPLKDAPTLMVPTDAGEAVDDAFKTMTINNPNAKTLLGGITLATGGQVNAQIPDVKSEAQAILRKELDLD